MIIKRWALLSLLIALSPVTAATAASGGGNLGDMVLDSKIESMKKAGVGPVIFPHTTHEKARKCDACHPKIFKAKRGANDLSMRLNMEGKICASPNCHSNPGFEAPNAKKKAKGKKAPFALINCANCHTKVKATTK